MKLKIVNLGQQYGLFVYREENHIGTKWVLVEAVRTDEHDLESAKITMMALFRRALEDAKLED